MIMMVMMMMVTMMMMVMMMMMMMTLMIIITLQDRNRDFYNLLTAPQNVSSTHSHMAYL